MRIVIHLPAKELEDALMFHRLKGDVKKMIPHHQLIIILTAPDKAPAPIPALASGGKEMMPPQTLLSPAVPRTIEELGKAFTAKLSEDLVPAIAMTGNHLGLLRMENGKLRVNPKALQMQLQQSSIPIIAPVAAGEEIETALAAAGIAAAVQADYLIFLIDTKGIVKGGNPLDTVTASEALPEPEQRLVKLASESLRDGTKRAFITSVAGMESLVLKSQPAPTEVVLP